MYRRPAVVPKTTVRRNTKTSARQRIKKIFIR